MAKVTITPGGHAQATMAEATMKAGECTTRWDDETREVYAVIPEPLASTAGQKPAPTADIQPASSAGKQPTGTTHPYPLVWTVPSAPIGTTLVFPTELLSGREIQIKGDGTPNGTVTCAKDATALVLLDAKEVVDLETIEVMTEAGGPATFTRNARGPAGGAWLCANHDAIDETVRQLPKERFRQGCEELAWNARAKNGVSQHVWIDRATPAVRRCTHPVASCCHVCQQFKGNPGGSPHSELRPCEAPRSQPTDGKPKLSGSVCRAYPIRATLECP
jgi:hypothetical protein